MTQILKEGGKTIIKTGSRIDTMNANQFEADIQPALKDGGVDLEMDCSELTKHRPRLAVHQPAAAPRPSALRKCAKLLQH